jgi:hypothetical protein
VVVLLHWPSRNIANDGGAVRSRMPGNDDVISELAVGDAPSFVADKLGVRKPPDGNLVRWRFFNDNELSRRDLSFEPLLLLLLLVLLLDDELDTLGGMHELASALLSAIVAGGSTTELEKLSCVCNVRERWMDGKTQQTNKKWEDTENHYMPLRCLPISCLSSLLSSFSLPCFILLYFSSFPSASLNHLLLSFASHSWSTVVSGGERTSHTKRQKSERESERERECV